jgi:arginase
MQPRNNLQIISAPSILGLKPTGVEGLPIALLSNGLERKLHSNNPVVAVPTLNHLYEFRRERESVLNAEALRKFSLSLCECIRGQDVGNKFLLTLGGDCSILIGIMLALKLKGSYGLFFFDAHADFYDVHNSVTGEAADMDLALITGRGPDSLTDIFEAGPYVKKEHVVHLGQRDIEETQQYHAVDIRRSGIKCFDAAFIQHHGVGATTEAISEKLKAIQLDGFWIHFDTDVINDEMNAAVDYRLPGGLSFAECRDLLKTILSTYNVVGMSVTIFNPSLDTNGKIAAELTALLSEVLT